MRFASFCQPARHAAGHDGRAASATGRAVRCVEPHAVNASTSSVRGMTRFTAPL